MDHAFADISSIISQNKKVWCIITSKQEIKILSEWLKLKYPNYEKIKLNKEESLILYNAKEKYPLIYQNFIFLLFIYV